MGQDYVDLFENQVDAAIDLTVGSLHNLCVLRYF